MLATDPQLRVHEWLAVIVVICLTIVLTLMTRISHNPLPATSEPPHYIVEQKIEVFVEGAVEHPVRLIVNRGACLEEVLKQAKLLPEADVSRLKLTSKVRRGQHIRVPSKKRRKSGNNRAAN